MYDHSLVRRILMIFIFIFIIFNLFYSYALSCHNMVPVKFSAHHQTGHESRVRSFPHVEGNYALHVFIPGFVILHIPIYSMVLDSLVSRFVGTSYVMPLFCYISCIFILGCMFSKRNIHGTMAPNLSR